MRGVILLLFLCLLAPQVQAADDRRVALVIANGAYAAVPPLANPHNDGKLVSDALKKAGFDTIDLRLDQGAAAFRETLAAFTKSASGADVALIYYAGHGLEVDGVNWLIPVDAKADRDDSLAREAVDLDKLMVTLAGARMRVAILDACRDNPFAVSGGDGRTRALHRSMSTMC
jgi:uncharacterized caspase-like protein